MVIVAIPNVSFAGDLPSCGTSAVSSNEIDCLSYSPAQFSYQESFQKLETDLFMVDQASAGHILDEFLTCFMRGVSRSGDFMNLNRGGSWGFLNTQSDYSDFFPVEIQDGVRLRKVNENLYALFIHRGQEFANGSGIHILKRDADDTSTVCWHPDIDSLTVARYAMIQTVPVGVSEAKVKDNLAVMRAASLFTAYDEEGSRGRSNFFPVIKEQFGIDEESLPSLLDGPKAYHEIEECFLDNRMFTDMSGLWVSEFQADGWRAFRVGPSRDIHFVYLGFTESPSVVRNW
ncbi:MAG: hypothetical protein G01um101420_663 [Parcubacteria group bacterium Gr01-1014_20]|nr:MAG: hypothetical protein G01um101420_663 [Parcubacteria group bacterium Gr01-1014_20]